MSIQPITEEDLVRVVLRHATGVRDERVAKNVAFEVMIYLRGHVLNDAERALLDTLSSASNQFSKLTKPTSDRQAAFDWAEDAHKIHDLQTRVLAVAAARIYPSQYRSLVTRE